MGCSTTPQIVHAVLGAIVGARVGRTESGGVDDGFKRGIAVNLGFMLILSAGLAIVHAVQWLSEPPQFLRTPSPGVSSLLRREACEFAFSLALVGSIGSGIAAVQHVAGITGLAISQDGLLQEFCSVWMLSSAWLLWRGNSGLRHVRDSLPIHSHGFPHRHSDFGDRRPGWIPEQIRLRLAGRIPPQECAGGVRRGRESFMNLDTPENPFPEKRLPSPLIPVVPFDPGGRRSTVSWRSRAEVELEVEAIKTVAYSPVTKLRRSTDRRSP